MPEVLLMIDLRQAWSVCLPLPSLYIKKDLLKTSKRQLCESVRRSTTASVR